MALHGITEALKGEGTYAAIMGVAAAHPTAMADEFVIGCPEGARPFLLQGISNVTSMGDTVRPPVVLVITATDREAEDTV